MNAVSRNADDSLDHVKARLGGREKHDDVASAYLPVGKNGPQPPRLRRELLAVHKYVIPDQQSVFHRAGRNLKGLHDESNNEQTGHQHRRQRREKLNRSLTRFFRLRFFFLGHYCFPVNWAISALVHYSKCPIPASELKQMADRVGEVIKFITRRGTKWHVVLRTPHRPVNQQRPPDNVVPRNEAPVAAVQALVPIVSEHEILLLRNNEFAFLDQFLHLQPPSPL